MKNLEMFHEFSPEKQAEYEEYLKNRLVAITQPSSRPRKTFIRIIFFGLRRFHGSGGTTGANNVSSPNTDKVIAGLI
jgi:hypothetical protein